MSDEAKRMTGDELAAVKREIDEFNAAHAADEEAKALRQAQEHRFVERRVWDAEQALLKRVPELLAHIEAVEAVALCPVQYVNSVDGREGVDIEYGEPVFVLNDDGRLIAARCCGSRWGGGTNPDAWVVKWVSIGEPYYGVYKTAPFQQCYRVPSLAAPPQADLRRERDQEHG